MPPSFQRSTSESSWRSALFVSLLYQKQNGLQISVIPRFPLISILSNFPPVEYKFSYPLKLPTTSYRPHHSTKIVASFLRNRRLHPIYYCKSFEFVIIASIKPYSNAS